MFGRKNDEDLSPEAAGLLESIAAADIAVAAYLETVADCLDESIKSGDYGDLPEIAASLRARGKGLRESAAANREFTP